MSDVTEIVMLRAAVKQLRADKDALAARLEKALEALRTCVEHMTEFSDAWQRGALESRDGKNGYRANMNMDALSKARTVLKERP